MSTECYWLNSYNHAICVLTCNIKFCTTLVVSRVFIVASRFGASGRTAPWPGIPVRKRRESLGRATRQTRTARTVLRRCWPRIRWVVGRIQCLAEFVDCKVKEFKNYCNVIASYNTVFIDNRWRNEAKLVVVITQDELNIKIYYVVNAKVWIEFALIKLMSFLTGHDEHVRRRRVMSFPCAS